VPPMSHPWKTQTFEKYVRSQKHYGEKERPPFDGIIYSQEIYY